MPKNGELGQFADLRQGILPKKGELGQFADLRQGFSKKEAGGGGGGCLFDGGLDTLMHTVD